MQPKWSLDKKYLDITRTQMQGLIKRKGFSFKKYLKSKEMDGTNEESTGEEKEELPNKQENQSLEDHDLPESTEDIVYEPSSRSNIKKSNSKESRNAFSVKQVDKSTGEEWNGKKRRFLIVGKKVENIGNVKTKKKIIKVRTPEYLYRRHKQISENKKTLLQQRIKAESKLYETLEEEIEQARQTLLGARRQNENTIKTLNMMTVRLKDRHFVLHNDEILNSIDILNI